VTGGGLSEGGQWVAVRHGFLLPMRVVMAVFRGKLLAAMRQGVVQGTRQLPAGQRRQQVENRLNQLGRAKWHVHIRERYPYGQGVLVYLARYVRGGPIANRRLLACDGQQVVLGYEERAKGPGRQAKRGTMRLPLAQFIGRWRLHVPPPGAVRVRCWGLYAHTQGARWRCAGSSSAKRRWRCPRRGSGSARARRGVRRIRNAVRSVGSDWCARP
jgi:Putative transposase